MGEIAIEGGEGDISWEHGQILGVQTGHFCRAQSFDHGLGTDHAEREGGRLGRFNAIHAQRLVDAGHSPIVHAVGLYLTQQLLGSYGFYNPVLVWFTLLLLPLSRARQR